MVESMNSADGLDLSMAFPRQRKKHRDVESDASRTKPTVEIDYGSNQRGINFT